MQFENEFDVAADPSQVIGKMDNLPLLASFLPGASVGPVNPDGSYPGTLVVSFGPKRIAFKGTVTHRVDRANLSGVLSGSASADVRGAKMAVTMDYRLVECAGASGQPATRVKFVSQAQLTGVLAEFAKTGGVVLTNAILAEFARRFSMQFEQAQFELGQFVQPGASAAPVAEPAQTLSAAFLVAGIFQSLWRSAGQYAARTWRALHSRT